MATGFELATIIKAAFDKTANTLGSDKARVLKTREILLKQADFGANQNTGFEKAFGSIAYTYLQEKAPGLLPYIVGFQLLDRSDEGNKAAGSFVAQIGDRVVDIPMFFINQELKGHHIMRLRSPELFLPLREAFIDYLFSRMPQDAGQFVPSGGNKMSPVPNQPDLQVFDANRMVKGGSLEQLDPWARKYQVAENYVHARTNPENLQLGIQWLKKEAAGTIINLKDFIASDLKLLKTAAKLADEYPAFKQGMENNYGPNWITEAADAYATRTKLAAQMDVPSDLIIGNKMSLNKSARVEVFTSVPSFSSPEEADLARKEIHDYGYYVWDKSAAPTAGLKEHDSPVQPSEALRITRPVDLNTPLESGVFKVMMSDGSFQDNIVLLGKDIKNSDQESDYDLIVNPSEKKIVIIQHDNYSVAVEQEKISEEPKLELNKKLDGFSDKPAAGDYGVFIGYNGQSSGLVRLEKKVSDDTFKVGYASCHSVKVSRPNRAPYASAPISSPCCGNFEEIRIYEGTKSSLFKVTDSQLLIPSTAKFIRLKKEPLDPTSPSEPMVRLDVQPTSGMSFSELYRRANLELNKIGADRYELNGRAFNKSAARLQLIINANLTKEAADEMLSMPIGRHRYFISKPGDTFELHKLADYPVQNLPFPQFMGPQSSVSGNYMVQPSEEQEVQGMPDLTRIPLREGETPEDRMAIPENMPGGAMPTGLGMGQGGDTVYANQHTSPEELFDVTGLIALINNSRIDSEIRGISKAILTGLDKLGRLVFLFYAHYDEFADMYGDEELGDLEKQLISALESLGDLFISLTRKSANPNPELDISTLQVGL